MNKLSHPLLKYKIPEKNTPGSFGFKRKFDIHTGVDLYCEEWDDVFAIEDGIVIDVFEFTGEKADSPWWNNTKAIAIKGESGVFLYGEISSFVKKGDVVKSGDKIAVVKKVLKKDKGTPQSMLHLELYNKENFIEPIWWKFDDSQEIILSKIIDPTSFLKKI